MKLNTERSEGSSPNWRRLLLPVVLLALSFTIRLAYLNQIESVPMFDNPTMDEKYHVELAEQINSREGLPKEPYFRAPLYPYFLASLFRIFSNPYYGARVVQIALGSVLPLLIYLLGVRLFSRRIALWSAAIAVFYPTFLYYDTSLLITSLMVLLCSLLVWQVHRCEGGSLLHFVIAGGLLGLAGLTRPNILLFGPALLIWVWLILKPVVGLKRAIIGYVIIGVASLVVILPVTIRNYVVADDFVFIAWQGGYNFFVGNNRNASGWSARVKGIDRGWEAGYVQSISAAEKAAGRKLKRSEVSDYWYRAALKDVKAAPMAYVAFLVKKMRYLINGYEIPNNQDIYLARQFSTIISPLLFNKTLYFPFGIIAPLGIIGLALSLKQWRRFLVTYIFLASYTATLMLFFVCARFRQPLLPVLLLFAVFGASELVKYIKKKKIGAASLFLLVFVMLVLESNHNILALDSMRVEAENHHMLGNAYLRESNLALALTEYKEAVSADSTYANVYNNIGVILTRKNRFAEAAEYFGKGIHFDPTFPEPYINLAICHSNTGDIERAIEALEVARERFPLNPIVHLELGIAFFSAGRFADAKTTLDECLRIDPGNTTARILQRRLSEIPPK